MAISCGAKCAKAFLIIFNLIYWVAGCALLVMGAWVFLDPTKNFLFQLVTTEGVSSNAAYYVAYLLITLGCLVVLVGFFGCCGALQESKCMLVLYFMFLFLMLIAEVAVAIVTLVYREQFLVGLQTRLNHQLNEKYGRNSVDNQLFTESVDLAQYKFNCCGISGDSDYNATKWRLDGQGSNGSRNVPLTCCTLANLDVRTI
uniref:Tetraspanin n=1 Tax=Timema shepardi TaxID=629360 RepID=A0A7R9ATC6_TIMSH|nr:unnamed protein product [Timema shepardi]